jgi:hypothetical protein
MRKVGLAEFFMSDFCSADGARFPSASTTVYNGSTGVPATNDFTVTKNYGNTGSVTFNNSNIYVAVPYGSNVETGIVSNNKFLVTGMTKLKIRYKITAVNYATWYALWLGICNVSSATWQNLDVVKQDTLMNPTANVEATMTVDITGYSGEFYVETVGTYINYEIYEIWFEL